VNAIFSNIGPFARGLVRVLALRGASALPFVLGFGWVVLLLGDEALRRFACFEFVRVGFALADLFARGAFTTVDFFAVALRFGAMP
jgi:hypothetical protein